MTNYIYLRFISNGLNVCDDLDTKSGIIHILRIIGYKIMKNLHLNTLSTIVDIGLVIVKRINV